MAVLAYINIVLPIKTFK